MRMEANAGLVAGSHNRNELVVIRPDSEGVSPNLDIPSIFGTHVVGVGSLPLWCSPIAST